MSRPHKALYDSRRWRRRSAQQLQLHALCERCKENGITTPAVHAHHRVPHNGNLQAFHYGLLESLCQSHHLREHGRAPAREFFTDIGADGWPIDPRHSVYQSAAARRET